MQIVNHEVMDNTIEFYGKDKTVVVSAELNQDNKIWSITNCETGTSNKVPASDNPVNDAHGIIAAVLGTVNGKALQV